MAKANTEHSPFSYQAMDNAWAANIAFDEMRLAEEAFHQVSPKHEKREALKQLHDRQDTFEWYMSLTAIWLERDGYRPQGLKDS